MSKSNIRLKLKKLMASVLVILILVSTASSTLIVFAEEGTSMQKTISNESSIANDELNNKNNLEQVKQVEQVKVEEDADNGTSNNSSINAGENKVSSVSEEEPELTGDTELQGIKADITDLKSTSKSIKVNDSKKVASPSAVSQSTADEGFKVNLRWGGTSNTTYTWNAENKEDRVIKLTFYYQNEVTSKSYKAGDITVTVPGIGNLNRDSCLKAADVAADEYGATELTRDWSYKYNSSTDTYTFYNNKAIEKGESFSGSFELLWQFSSRECINGYSQSLQATLDDGEKSVLSQELTLDYTSKKDNFFINKTAAGIISADGLNRFVESGKHVTDYAWIQYTFIYNTQELNARGLQNRYLLDTFPEGCVIATSSNVIKNEDGTVSYKVEENELSEYNYKEYSIIVGYPAEQYAGTTVKNTVYLKGTYKDEKEEELLASSEVEVKLNRIDQGFNFNGYVITTDKAMSPYLVYRDTLDKDINFTATLRATTSVKPIDQEEYGIALTDDLIEIYTDDYHRLTDDEYEFTSVTVPGKNNFYNANGYVLEDGNYTVTIKALYKENINTRDLDEYTTIYEGGWTNESITQKLENTVVAIRVEINGLTESIKGFYIYASGKINISESDYENPSYIINYSFTDFFDNNGNYLIEDIKEENYSRKDLYDKDAEIYGKGLQRASGTIIIAERVENPGYYYARAKIENFEADKEIENFVTTQAHSIDVYNTNAKEITKIEIHGVNGKEDLETLIETLKFTYDNLKFKYKLSDDILSNDENMQDYLRERATIEKNGKEITVTFNFEDNPIVATRFNIGYTVESNLSYENYYEETNPSYSITTYALIEGAGLNPQFTRSYNSKTMAYETDSSNILLALASHQQLIKLIKTEYTNGEFVEDGAVVPLNTEYTYRLKLRNGYNTLEGTEFIDILEHAELTNVDGEYPYEESEWYGKLKSVDTKYLENKGHTVRVYYANTTTPAENDWTLMETHSNGIWQTENEVQAIKVEIDGEIEENSIIHVDVNMQAPTDETKVDKYAYNTYQVSAEAIDVYTGLKSSYLQNMPSNSTEVRLTEKEYNLEISKVDAESGSKLKGVTFGIYDEEGNKIRTNITGILGNTIIKALKEGTYTIKEEIVPLGYEAPEDYTLIIENGNYTLKQGETTIEEGTAELNGTIPTIKITIENKRAKGSITVYKIDEYLDENKQEIPLEGVEFELQDTDENVIDTGTTDANGEILFDDLAWGKTYVIKETNTLNAYELAPSKNTYLSKLLKDKVVVVENERKEGSAVLTKEDEKDESIKLASAKYGLYAQNAIYDKAGEVKYEKDSLIKSGTTNEQGQVSFENLIWGDYYIKEIESIYGYDLSEEKYEFTINAETVENAIEKTEEEQRSKAKLELIKLDSSGGFLQGAEFTVFDENGEKVVNTNVESGEEELTFTSNETYKWSQNNDGTWQSESYDVNNSNAIMESNEFTLPYEGTISFDWSVSSESVNYDYVYYTITNTETGTTIGGTSNKIGGTSYGTNYDSLIFNNVSEELEAGTYKIAFTYRKDSSALSGLDRAFVKNVKVAYEKIEEIPLVSTTDENGQLNIENIEWGTYYIQETKVPQGYENNDTKYYFTVNRETFLNDNKVISVVTNKTTNEDISIIKNNRKKGKVTLTKYKYGASGEETTEPLEGAVFELYLSDGTKVGEYTSDENGKMVIENLDWGSYYFQEKEAPAGYSVSNKKISFVINSKNVDFEQNLVAYNKQETGEIKINKTIKANSIVEAHGNVSFMFKIVGKDGEEEKVTLYRTATFTTSDIPDEQGNITKTIVISDSERYKYEITEENNYRYELDSIIPVTSNSGVNGKIGTIDLTSDNKGEITFVNNKANNSLLTDAKLITNTTQSDYYLIGISAESKEESYVIGTKLTASDFTFTLYYSGGQEVEIETPQDVTLDGESTYTQVIEGNYIINIEATVNGKTFETETITKWIMPSDYFNYRVIDSSENTIAITGVNLKYSSPTVLYIPSEYNGYKVIDLSGLTNISNVKSVVIEEGVQSIGYSAFGGCRSLTSIEIPDSVTSIGYMAFYQCGGLTSINIPNSVTSIGNSAFSYCSSLTSIEIPDSVTSIGKSAFSSCTGLASIEIPDSVTSIGNSAFSYCSSLTSIEIPDSITSIGIDAFSSCTGLASIEIPDSVTSIGNGAFSRCTGLISINVDINNENYFSSNGVLFNKEMTKLIKYPEGKKDITSYIIPSSVTSIEDVAMVYCTSLTNVEIPDSVTSIGSNAFAYCTGLTSIEIPDSVTSIGSYAFINCSGLTSVTIGEGVTSIQYGAFYECISLTSIEIPSGVTVIEFGTFSMCTRLTSMTMGEGVTNIGNGAFNYCYSLTTINYHGTEEEFNAITIGSNNDYFENATVNYITD